MDLTFYLVSFTIGFCFICLTKTICKNNFYNKTVKEINNVPIKELYQCSLYSQLAYEEPLSFFTNIIPSFDEKIYNIYFDCIEKITLLKKGLTTHAIYIDARENTLSGTKEDTQLYLFSNKNILYVVFRGTSSLFDIKTDLNVFISTNKWAQVHKGFFKQYNAIYLKLHQEILNWISIHENEIDTIIFTGHSLGGALALLASYDIKTILHKNYNIKCYSFGAPRIGNQSFIKELEKKDIEIWRVCNIEDIVPLLPISFRFTHCDKNTLFLMFNQNDETVHFATNQCTNGFEFNHNWYLRPLGLFIISKWYNPFSQHKSQFYTYMLKSINESNNKS